MRNKLFFILVFFICVFSIVFVSPAYSEDLKNIRVYGVVSYQGVPLAGAPVYLFYGYGNERGSYPSLLREDLITAYTNQYGYYSIVTNIDLDRMDEIAATTPGGWCEVMLGNYFYGLYHPSGHPEGVDVRTGDNFNINFTDTENYFENMFDPMPQVSGVFVARDGVPIGNANIYVSCYNDRTGSWDRLRAPENLSPSRLRTNSDGYFNFFIDNVHYGIGDSSTIRITLKKIITVRGDRPSRIIIRGSIDIPRTSESVAGDFERYNVIIREP